MKLLTLREVFLISREHLLKQNCRALAFNGPNQERCVFRNAQGLKCAVGVFIPESSYQPGLEHEPLDQVTIIKGSAGLRQALLDGGVDVRQSGMLQLLQSLQIIHDRELPDAAQGWSHQFKLLAVSLEPLLGRFEEYEDAYPVAPLAG
jgi:hypothetical protein